MTIRDVAARTGVSAATVSRVFAHGNTVSSATRQRVLAAVDELHTHPPPGWTSPTAGDGYRRTSVSSGSATPPLPRWSVRR